MTNHFIAHAPDHELVDHLESVARLARSLAPPRGETWAYLAGLWHDLGKFRPGFQQYIRQNGEASMEGRTVVGSDKTHSAAGAVHAMDQFINPAFK